MNMKKLLAMVLAAVMMLSLCACGGEAEETQATETTEATQATEATQETQATEATEETEPEGTVYKVTVVDEEGNPVSGVMVQICFETCLPAMTNENGVAEYRVDEADYKVSFLMVPEGYAADQNEYHFDEGAYELTLTLKAAE